MDDEIKLRMVQAYDEMGGVLDCLLWEENWYQDEIRENASRLAGAMSILQECFIRIGIDVPRNEEES